MKTTTRSLLLGFLLGPLSVCALRGATLYWDPDGSNTNDNFSTGTGLGGTTGTWNLTNAFWNPGDGSTDLSWNNAAFNTAYFWGTAGTVTLSQTTEVGGLAFATTGYTITGSTLDIGSGTALVQFQNVAAATINSALSGSGTLVLESQTYGGQTLGTLTLGGGGTAFTGSVVVDNGMTVILTGTGGTTLSNASGLTLNNGSLTMTNTTNAMGALNRVNDAAPVTSNGGTITYTNTASGSSSYAETLGALTLNSGRLNLISTNATIAPATETLTLSGLVHSATSAATLAVGGAGVGANAQNRIVVTGLSATTPGQIIGAWATFGTTAAAQTDYLAYDATNGFIAANITASTEDTWTTAANAYTAAGATTLTASRTIAALRYTGGTADFTLGAGMNLQTYGILNGGSGVLSVQPGTGGTLSTPAGGGNLFFITGNGQGITVNAPITDNGGIVKVVNSGGSTLVLGNSGNSFTGGVTLDSGTVSIATDGALGNANGGVTFDGSAALTFTTSATLLATRTITLNNTSLATINTGNAAQTISGNVTGTGGLIVNGGSTLNLNSTNNDFQGELRIGNGTNSTTVSLNSLADSAQANGAIRLGSGTTTGTLVWAAAAVGDLTLNNRQIDLAGTTGGGLITNNSTFNLTINTNLLVSGSGTKTLTLQGTGNGSFNGVIDGHGSTISVTKTGTGTWTLGGANTFTGTLSVSQGTLIFGSAANLGAATTAVAVGSGSTTSGILTYAGAGETITRGLSLAATTTGAATLNSSGTGPLNWQGNVSTAGTNKTFTLGATNTGGDNTFSGTISIGTGNLTKNGAGTWVLTAANTFVNTTIGSSTVAGGTLRLTGAGTLGSGTLTVNNGLLDIEGSSDVTATGTTALTMGGGPAGAEAFITLGAGRALNLNGNFTFSATNSNLTATISGGAGATLNLGGAARTFSVADSANAAYDVLIDSSVTVQNGSVVKTGAGTLVIGSTNSISSFDIQAGALMANLGTTNLLLDGGVYQASGTFARDIGTGANQVQWNTATNGGFAAEGGPLTVTLSSGAQLAWDSTPSFVNGAGQLLFGSVSSDNVVTFTNNIDLNVTAGAVTRTIQVLANTASTNDETVFTGVLSASGSGAVTLTKSGAGTLVLQDNNTFTGTVSVTAGLLQFSQASNLGAVGNAIALGGGTLQYTGTGDLSLGGAVTLTAASGVINTGTGTLQFMGGLTMSNNLTLDGASPIAIGGTLTNAATTGTITVTDTAGVTLNNINLTDGTTARTLDISVAAGITVTVNGVVTNGGTGSSAFRKDGPGTLVLKSASAFTNELRLNQGTLEIDVTPSVLQTSTNSIVFNNTNVLGATTKLLLEADYNLSGTVEYIGNSSNAQSTATITGPGRLNLTGSRTFDIRPSTDPTGEMLIQDVIADGSATGSLTKIRNGTLVLSGNNTYTGGTTASGGLLLLDYSTNTGSKISSTGLLTFSGGALELAGNATANIVQGVTGLTVSTGGNALIVDSTAGGSVTLNIGGALTSTAAGRTIDFQLVGTASTINTSAATGWTLTNGILGGWATFDSSRFASVDGSGNIIGVGTAKDNVSTWGLLDNVVDNTGYTGVMAPEAHINSLVFSAPAAATINVTHVLNLDSGGLLIAPSVGANSAGLSGGNLIASGSALFISQFNTTQAFTISSAIRGNTSLTKSGGGDLILNSSTNDYTGVTQINGGTLIVMGGNAIGDSSAVTLDEVTGESLKLMDDETIGSLAGGGADGGFVDIGTHTLTLTNGATFSGNLLGSGTIIKNGTTNWQLNNVDNPNFFGTVIAEQGLVQLTGSGVDNLEAAAAIVIDPGGALLVDNNGATTTANRITDTAPITLNSANGQSGTAAPIRGLWVRTDQNGTRTETVGAMTFNSGANYSVFEASTTVASTASISEIVAASFTRNNNATLVVRGMNLGTSSSIQRGRFRLTSTAESAFTAANFIGGAGAAGSPTISIVPWVIGEDFGTNLQSTTANSERGNSFVTYVTGVGFRPLNFTNEYSTYALATATSNVRETLGGDLTGLAGQTINALVLNNVSSTGVNVTGSGPLVVTSGAFLFTAVDSTSATGAELATPQGITLGGFDNITVGPAVGAVGNEFIFHVVDSAAGGITISSNLIDSIAGGTDLTKSGIGTLFLTGNNTYTGTTTINEGTLDINSWNAIGGAAGSTPLIFAGGTLQLDPTFSGSFSRPIQLAVGGGTITNNADVALNGVISDLPGMDGTITKSGTGNLTINTPATYTGPTSILAGTWTLGVNQGIGTGDLTVNGATLQMQSFNATVGKVTLANSASSLIDGTGTLTSNGNVFDVQRGVINVVLAGTSGLIKDTTSTGNVTLNALNTYTGPTEVRIGTLSFNTIGDIGGGPSALGAPATTDAGTIRAGSTTNSGGLQYTGTGNSSDRPIDLVGTTGGLVITQNGTGPLTLSGDIVNAFPGAKTIQLQGTDTDNNTLSGDIIEDGNGVITLIKTNAGKWILAGNNTYTGNTQISQGTLVFSAAANLGDVNSAASILIGNGTTTGATLQYLGAGDTINDKLQFNTTTATATIDSSGTGALIFADPGAITALAGTKTVTLTGSDTAANEIKGIIQNNSSTNLTNVSKTGAGLWVLSGANTYTGTTTVNGAGGILRIPVGGALGVGATTVTAGTLDLQNGAQSITTLTMGNGAAGSTSDVELNGGALSLGGNVTVTASTTAGTATINTGTINLLGDRTFTVNDSTAATVDMQISSVIADGDGTAHAFIKAGNGTLVLTAANTYTGTTSVNAGVLQLTSSQTLTGALQFGSTSGTTTAGTLDLSQASLTVPSLVVQTNSSTAVNNLVIGLTQTLTVNGNVAIGSPLAGSSTTLFTASGGGTLIVNDLVANALFQVGGVTTSASQGNKAIVDLSGLGQLTVSLNTSTGIFRINPTNSNNVSDKYSTLTLAQNNTITAGSLAVGDGAQGNDSAGQVNSLYLGAGTNIINVNTLNISTTNRDVGQILFAGSTGTVQINNTAGNGRTTFNMGTGATTGVGTPQANVFDVTGHQAQLLLGVVSLGTENRGAAYADIFSFDTGSLDMTSVVMATRSADSGNGLTLARDTTSTLNLGGGATVIQSGITGMATAAGAYTATDPLPNVTATVTISGGTVNIGATSGNSIVMGNFTATGGAGTNTGSAVATVNLTGGVTTLSGNIVKGGTSALINSTVNLSGGTLDMGGHSIGAAAPSDINFVVQSGTLKNLGQLDGGGALTKTSSGTLIIAGTNTYTGQTIVNQGTVLVSGSITGSVMVNSGGTLGGNGGTTGAVTVNTGGTLAPGSNDGILNTGAINLLSGGHMSFELGPTVAGTGYDQLNVTGGITLGGDLQLNITTGFADQVNDTFYLILNDGSDAVSNQFSNVTPVSATTGTLTLGDGRQFLINYAADAPMGDGGGNDVSATLIAAIPEPDALSLAAASIGLSLGLQRLRRRR